MASRHRQHHRAALRAEPRNNDPAPLTTVHRLKVTLRGVKPPVWRRIEVHSSVMLKAIADPGHDEHMELTEWLPADFDAEHFDADEATQAMQFPPLAEQR